MRILLDTVTFLWALAAPARLSKSAAYQIQRKNTSLELSSVSLSEIAIKKSKGKLDVSREELQCGLENFQVRVLPYAEKHALRLFELPLHHKDPFDRQIITQALEEKIPIATCDKSFSLYDSIEIIW